MPSTKLQKVLNSRLFGTRNALVEALTGSTFITGMMFLAHLDNNWVIDKNFHPLFTFIFNTTIIFAVLGYSFIIIRSQMKVKWKYIFVIAGSILITIVLSLLSNKIHTSVYNGQRLSEPSSINMTRDIAIAIITILFALILYNLYRRHRFRIETEQLQTENVIVRYEALENQLDPHFLFNSLNTLSGLIGNDDDKAHIYLQQLASTYRYIMQNRKLVDLNEELLFVKSYCEMMKIRYGDNITFERHIDTRLLHYQIIPISIQLLIENALKHNIISNRYPLTIILSTTDEETFRVSNVMQPKQEDTNGVGLGLANLAKRYELLCGKEITISDKDGVFSVEVPILNPNEVTKIIDRLQIKEENE